MKIVFQAFRWTCHSQTFDLKNFLNELNKVNGNTHGNRISYFLEDGNYWVGLILTIKNMRKFVTLVESKKEIKLDVHELDDNEKITDFNFFVLSQSTGYGLYQHYHQSCSLNTFNYIVRQRYNAIRKSIFLDAKEKYEKEGKNKSDVKKLMKKYQGIFTPIIIERKGSFVERVKKMNDANFAEIEFAQLDFNNNSLQAIQPFLKTMKFRMSFLKTVPGISKIRSIVDILTTNTDTTKKVTIEGVDEHGHDVVYRLFNDFDKFKECDYEDMVPSLSLDKEKFADSIKNNNIVVELKSVFDSIAPVLP